MGVIYRKKYHNNYKFCFWFKMLILIFAIFYGNVEARGRWKQILAQMNDAYAERSLERSGGQPKHWGRTIENSLVHWSQCPPIDMPNNMTGVQRVFCDSATCVVDCEPGFNPLGNNRANCRKLKGKYKWTKELPTCGTCSDPVFPDDRISTFCYIERGTNQKVCELRCNDGISKVKSLKVESIKCSCEKSNCHWRSGRGKNKKIVIEELTCLNNKKEFIPRLVPCRQKPAECTDITENMLLSPTWSCPECVLIQSIFHPSETFDHRDFITVQFPSAVSFINFSYPIRRIENVSGNNWNLHLHESQLISVNKNGNSKVTWSAEIKYAGGQPSRDKILDLTTVQTCPCF